LLSFSLKQVAAAVGIWALCSAAQAAGITTTDYKLLLGQNPQGVALSSARCETNPPKTPDTFGCSLDKRLDLGPVGFGEHFKGQTVSAAGDFDALSSPASLGGPLELMVGDTGKNLYLQEVSAGTVALGGVGPAGSEEGRPLLESAGTGAVSILFADSQSQFGIQINDWDGNGGPTLFIAFFDARGNRIGEVFELVAPPRNTDSNTSALSVVQATSADLGFVSSERNIAGVSIWNKDDGGLSFSGMVYSQAGTPGTVPEPGALLLAGLALVGAARVSRRR
jgi:PEP-CTERM motif